MRRTDAVAEIPLHFGLADFIGGQDLLGGASTGSAGDRQPLGLPPQGAAARPGGGGGKIDYRRGAVTKRAGVRQGLWQPWELVLMMP
jgi:hypothetical protein